MRVSKEDQNGGVVPDDARAVTAIRAEGPKIDILPIYAHANFIACPVKRAGIIAAEGGVLRICDMAVLAVANLDANADQLSLSATFMSLTS